MSRNPHGTATGYTGPQAPGAEKQPQIEANEQTVYRGRRDPSAPVGSEVEITVDVEILDKRYDLLSASPTGFEYGYGGSGPAQLAIAMLAHAFDDEFATDHYQRFKREVIATLPEEGWTLTKEDLEEWREVSIDGEA